MSALNDIRSFIPISRIVKRAALDMYEDLPKVEARFQAWAIDGLKKLCNETLKSGKRYAVLTVNQKLGTATLPCDFKSELFVGLIDECGQKIPLNINPNIVNKRFVETIECDIECPAKCEDTLPKQACCDLEQTQVLQKVKINNVDYDETLTKTLMENGDYMVITETPFLNVQSGLVEYRTKKSYLAYIDTAECGCIKDTAENAEALKATCYEAYCCYCGGCTGGSTDFGGYQIFTENNLIQFDGQMTYDKVYMEYRGSLPKQGNEYLVPEVAKETLINLTKFFSVQNKKNVPKWDREWHFSQYTRERDNMLKVLGRMKLADIIHSALMVPKFEYNVERCYAGGVTKEVAVAKAAETVTVVTTTNVTSTCPAIIQITGAQMVGGVTYNNSVLAGINVAIFANGVNRYLQPGEFTLLPGGGFTITTGVVYGIDDYFFIFPIC